MADVNPELQHRNLPLLLLLAREGVINRFRPVLQAHGLTEQQWRILRVLVEVAALEPRQIGQLCGLSSPSLAGILARMEEQGLVARAGLAHDKRRQLISATPASRRLAQRMAPKIEAVYAALELQLGAEVVAQLYTTLDAVLGALAAEPPAAGSIGRRR
ncbi:MAG: homoprotocatechuate degradation operon regulator HpaR [Rubrivivax sp.]|nr:homoprotocatechuate degradation operon regulator HpaR [Rubrivivax sp.]